MRTLVILRGAMGAGKSTWLKENGLEAYTLSPDTIRLMYSSPQMQPDEFEYTITQKNDDAVWSLLFEILEKRMQKGEFTIIDATHSRQSDFSQYNALCETYRYRRCYIDFTDVPIEVCKAQNMHRLPAYKRVPSTAIDKCYARFETQKAPNSWLKIERELINSYLSAAPIDFNDYERVHIFGDIHGCYEPLKEYLTRNEPDIIIDYNKPAEIARCINPKDFYIFVGDYVDRGIQNKEVMELLCELAVLPNTLFLPGNHEEWIRMFVFGQIDDIRSKEFKCKTMYELKDIEHNKLATFVRKLGQMAYFKFDDTYYFVTHGGLPYLPDKLQLVATDQFIHGVGTYAFDIDKQYSETQSALVNEFNVQDPVVQVHGHRNTFGIKMDEYPYSYNLEGRIEFGGDLRVLLLEHDKKPQCIYIKNNVYNTEEIVEYVDKPLIEADNLVAHLRSHKYIKETDLGNGISSFNFTRDAFYDKHWDEATISARGLFIDTQTGNIVARAYNKFFNINERQDTKMISVRGKLETEGSAVAYKKYNGYLGILSYYNDDLQFHSKSTNQGNFATWFKEIFMATVKPAELQLISDYLKEYNVSMVFEVIDPINDPHIIKNDKAEVILLDIIDNSLEYHKCDYTTLYDLASQFCLKVKEVVAEFKDFRSLMQFWLNHTDEDNMNDDDIEGVVIEIGDFMVKMKFTYYNFWKMCRKLVDQAKNNRNIKLGSLYNDKANYFWAWLHEQTPETLEKDIITLRDMFENKG